VRVGIFAALKEEIEPLLPCIEMPETSKWGRRSLHQGRIAGCQVVALAGGVGKVKAAACTQFLIDSFSVEALVCTGVAGAINPKFRTGDVVISEKALEHDFDPGEPKLLKRFRRRWLVADPNLVTLALEAARDSGAKVQFGKMLTGDQAIVSREKRRWLWDTFRADCVDMETAAVAGVCRLNGVPWVAVRAISDSAMENGITEFRENLVEGSGAAAKVVERLADSLRRA
jgi:adenosylhomocysteine nucleosidase